MNSENPVKSVRVLTTDVILPAEPPYARSRMYGAVGEALSDDGRPYPYRQFRLIQYLGFNIWTLSCFIGLFSGSIHYRQPIRMV